MLVLALSVAAVVSPSYAQEPMSAHERAKARRLGAKAKVDTAVTATVAQEAKYSTSTRVEANQKSTGSIALKLNKLGKAHELQDAAEVRLIADELLGDSKASPYERAYAARMAAYAAYDADDAMAAMSYLQKTIELDGLDNNGHFDSMYMLAQLQVQDEKYSDALVTIDRFLAESKSSNPEHLVLKGNALYRMDKHAEAAAVLKQAIAATPEPRADWQALLMGALAESGDAAGAATMAEQVAAKSPADKRAQLNLVSVYQQSNQNDKAIAVLERLRSGGQLTEDKDYRILYALYANADNQEAKTIAVINEGLAKDVLKADYNTLITLAQSYYYSDQVPKAIDAYRKAAPLAKDGETYLNLAKVLWQSDRVAEAKDAAREAKAKGLKNPAEADKVLALTAK